MSHGTPLLSVVVVSWNTRELLAKCLASVQEHLASLPHEILVVDNASADGSQDLVRQQFPAVRLIENAYNLGFGAANNLGMAAAAGRHYLLLNSDAFLIDSSVVALVTVLERRPEVGAVGPLIRFPDGRIQASARRFGNVWTLAIEELGLYKLLPSATRAELLLGGYWDHNEEREVDWLLGACFLVRREAFEATSGFDPAIFLYGEEVEWCYRIREAGFAICFSPAASVVHVGHASADKLVGEQGRIDLCLTSADQLTAKWQGRMAGALAPAIRVVGAALKLIAFAIRGWLRGDDAYGRDVRAYSRQILTHYHHRLTGRQP